jgi:uncharacterized protein YdgA (DUF945 family)
MKRLVTVAVVMAVLLVGAPWVIGNVAEDRVDRGLGALVEAAPYLGIVDSRYTRGWFRSEQEVTFEVLGGALRPFGAPPRFTVRNEILHGPVLGLSGLGIARVNSTLVLDAGTRAALVRHFGTDEPLRVSTRVGFLGGGTTTLSSDAREVKLDDGGTISWDDLEIDIGYSRGLDSMSVTGDWPRFEARNPRLKSFLRVEDVVLDASSKRVQGHLYETDGDFTIDDLTFAGDGAAPTTVKDLRFVLDTTDDGDFMSIASRWGSGRFYGGLLQGHGGPELTAMHCDVTVRRLHTETLVHISNAIAESHERPAAATLLPDAMLELLKHDPELLIDRVGFETEDGAAYLKGVIRLKGATEKDLRMGVLSLIQRLDADLRFEAPQKVIEGLPGGREAMLGAVDGGYAELKGSHVASHVEFRAGELKINDKVQGIPGLEDPFSKEGAASPE